FFPDKSFYTSAALAMEAPPETCAYISLLQPPGSGNPDALVKVGLDANASSYGKILDRIAMPFLHDELHHFGWNACSSALCPFAPHPHIERRYLMVPGLRSSRLYIIDTRSASGKMQLIKTIEAAEIAKKTGYSRIHTIHCGPSGVYVNALGSADGKTPGGIFLLDHETFSVMGKWEVDRGPQQLAYDFWWHLGHDTMVTSEWASPNMFENGLVAEKLLNNEYGHKLHFWSLSKRKH